MKEAVTKVIDILTQDNFPGALLKLLERSNKCIAAGGDYLEGDLSFMCVLSIKVPIQKKSGNLSYAPRISFTSTQFKSQIFLFDLLIGPYHVLPLRVIAYMGAKAMSGYSIFSNAPEL